MMQNQSGSQIKIHVPNSRISLFRSKLTTRLGDQSNAVLFDLISSTNNDIPVESDLNLAEEVTVETSETSLTNT